MTDSDTISLQNYFERLLEERAVQYNERFHAAEIAFNAALVAQEKAVGAAFLASEKAITKAEESQRDYNIRSNEFRGQLDDQAKLLMSRSESLSLHAGTAEKIEIMRTTFDTKLESQRIIHEKAIEAVRNDVTEVHGRANLYYSKTEMDGRIREFFTQVDNAEKARTIIGDRVLVVEKFAANIQGRFYAFSIGITIVMVLLAMASFLLQHIK